MNENQHNMFASHKLGREVHKRGSINRPFVVPPNRHRLGGKRIERTGHIHPFSDVARRHRVGWGGGQTDASYVSPREHTKAFCLCLRAKNVTRYDDFQIAF